MGTEIITDGEGSNSTPPPPTRRSARNRRASPLVESFTNYVEQTPRSEVEELSKQLNIALGAIANNNATPTPPPAKKLGGLSRASQPMKTSKAATSAGRMILDRPNGGGHPPQDEQGKTGVRMKAAASAGSLTNGGSSRRTSCKQRSNRQFAKSMAPAIPDWKGYYAPKSSSRRNSRAGSELSISMKMSAQKALAELGEVTDDEDLDDDDWLAMSCMKEETVDGIISEEKDY